MDYRPTQEDLDWAKALLRNIKDGGVWGVPTSRSIYFVSHTDKTLIRTSTLDEDDLTKIHERSVVVFGQLGYTVKVH